jgi:uncharacterized membrane protein
MSDLVVIAFPTEAKAEEVRQKLLAMQKEYLQQFPIDLNQDGFRGPGEALWH